MSRLQMSGNLPAELAERVSDINDELTAAEQQAIDARASEIIAERLTDGARFRDLMSGLESDGYDPYWHQAFLHVENAVSGDMIAAAQVIKAVRQFANVVRAEAEIVWREECNALAERELREVES